MWHWDQGHLGYFDFDILRAVAAFSLNANVASASKAELKAAVGLSFAAPPTHSAWRQYGRVFKTALLISERNGIATPTAVAHILAKPGLVTTDEYFHFLVQASTEPNPGLKGWSPSQKFRYPLLFCIRYLLAKAAISPGLGSSLNELIGAYKISNFVGDETDTCFINLLGRIQEFSGAASSVPKTLRRQASESIKAISQISYLYIQQGKIFVNLAPDDARDIFLDLSAYKGKCADSPEEEITRLALLFKSGSTQTFFDYPSTIISSVLESGFVEGTKVEKSHVTIERNGKLRAAFFANNMTTTCDVCSINTALSFPWTDRVLDLHHLLPLSSGTRVVGKGTTLDDLVAICPTCHRGVHRYYSTWLKKQKVKDFASREEAVGVYQQMKMDFPGLVYA